MKKRWVVPDTHGHCKTLKALVEEQIRPTRYDELYFLGDYIDRGPDSKGVIDYIRHLQKDEYNVTVLKGNHEDIMVDLYEAEIADNNPWYTAFYNKKRRSWYEMGGKKTLQSFNAKTLKEVPSDYIEWMKGLDYYASLDDFVLVHAGLNFNIEDPFSDRLSMLWIREYKIKPEMIGNRRIIHGHVPVNIELIDISRKNRYYKFIDLDNGVYLKGIEGFGNLVALEMNSMEIIIQDNRDL
jgi:serine/threonine protein phosphatase 1